MRVKDSLFLELLGSRLRLMWTFGAGAAPRGGVDLFLVLSAEEEESERERERKKPF